MIVTQSCLNLWTIALQVPLSMDFSRQEYWNGLLFPSPGDLPNPRIEPGSPTLQADSLPSKPSGKPHGNRINILKFCNSRSIEIDVICLRNWSRGTTIRTYSRKVTVLFLRMLLWEYIPTFPYSCSKENTIQVQIERHFIKYLTNIFQMC